MALLPTHIFFGSIPPTRKTFETYGSQIIQIYRISISVQIEEKKLDYCGYLTLDLGSNVGPKVGQMLHCYVKGSHPSKNTGIL